MMKDIKNDSKPRLQIKNEKAVNIILLFMAILGVALIIALIVILIMKNI